MRAIYSFDFELLGTIESFAYKIVQAGARAQETSPWYALPRGGWGGVQCPPQTHRHWGQSALETSLSRGRFQALMEFRVRVKTVPSITMPPAVASNIKAEWGGVQGWARGTDSSLAKTSSCVGSDYDIDC